MGEQEIETYLELKLRVSGHYIPGQPPTPMRGEAMAVTCPGWGAHIEDLAVCLPNGKDITDHLDEKDREALETELIDHCREG